MEHTSLHEIIEITDWNPSVVKNILFVTQNNWYRSEQWSEIVWVE